MKSKSIAVFFFFISVMVMTGHAVVPHDHEQLNTNLVECHDHHTLFERFKEIFSVDIGIQHLDDYVRSEKNDTGVTFQSFSIFYVLYYPFSPIVKQEQVVTIYPKHYSVPIRDTFYKDISGLRAPPVL